MPLHGVGAVAEEVRQLEGLLDLLEEHLDLPAATVKISNGLRAPFQVVRQKGHLPQLAVHFDQCHDTTQLDGIVFARRAGEADQVVAQDVPVAAPLETAHDPAAQVVLGAGDPKDAAYRQIGQMGEIQIRLVEDDNLPGPHARAEFAGAEAVVFPSGADDGEAEQEGLQVQAEMTFGGGLAAAVFGPVETAGDKLNGGGIHQMDGALEAEGKLGATAAPKAGMELLEMFEHPPEEVLGHLGWALPVGGGKAVLAGRAGPAQGRERTRVQPQGVADVVEAEGVGELGEDQAHHMTPRREGAGFFCDPGVPGQLGNEVRRNQIAELAQEGEAAARWLADRLFFHPRPCGRVQTCKPTLFFTSPNHQSWETAVNLKESPFGPKIADAVPKNGVPRNWTKEQITDAITDYETSIASRKAEQAAFDAGGRGNVTERLAHARRITEEESFLKSLEKALENRR